MIGYLQPVSRAPEIHQLYRSYQCGLCHTLGAEYGFHYRVFAQPDLVFFNVFMDLCGDGAAAIERKACPLVPVVSRNLPVRQRTEHTRFTAAFGVFMAVEKLRDDWQDERGWHRWVLLQVYARGQRQARAVLVADGFPVERVEALMRDQARVEATASMPLEQAAVPTTSIARTLFRHATKDSARAGITAAIGERVGGFLFYMDNLIDFGKDVKAGGYNALARVAGETELSAMRAREGIAGAEAQVRDLDLLVPTLGIGQHAGYLRDVLITGFRDKIERFRGMDGKARAKATLRDLRPRPAGGAFARAQLMVIATLLLAFPRLAWAQRLFLRVSDTGDTGAGDPETGWDRLLDTCYCSSACNNCCGDPCESACDGVCDSACDNACDGVDCGSGCSS